MKHLTLTALVALTLCATPAGALTIEEAVVEALRGHPLMQEAAAREQAAEARTEQARAPFWPTLQTRYEWSHQNDSVFSSDETSRLAGSARFNLFNGGSDLARLDAAQEEQRAATTREHGTRADIALAAREAYIEALRAERSLDTASRSLDLLEAQRREAELRLAQGLIARNDLLRIRVDEASARQAVVRAEGQRRTSRQALARALGRPRLDDETLSDPPLPEAQAPEAEPLAVEMLARRSELSTLRHELAKLRAQRSAVRGDLLPELDLTVSHSRFGNHALPASGDPDYDRETTTLLQASWTLFSGFGTRSELAALGYDIAALEAVLREAEDRLRLQLHAAVEALRTAGANLDTASASVALAEENYRVNESRLQARVATTVDLLDAEAALTRARNEQVAARYDLYRAAAALDRVLERDPLAAH